MARCGYPHTETEITIQASGGCYTARCGYPHNETEINIQIWWMLYGKVWLSTY